MHTVSSARRTFIAWASAVECTATVLMPISWQARLIRRAISPRLAISTFSNISGASRGLFDQHQGCAVFDRLALGSEDPGEASGMRRTNLVHYFHRLDDQQCLAGGDRVANAD